MHPPASNETGSGFWYGGHRPPSPLLIDQIEAEDPRSREAYALQDGRERGGWVPLIEQLRRQLPAFTDETATLKPRSPAAALRRSLRHLSGDADRAVDLLSNLGSPTGEVQGLRAWLTQDPRRRDDADAALARVWRPRPGGLLAALLESPGLAAAQLGAWLSPAAGGPVRIVTHGEAGLSAPLRSRLLATRVAAYQRRSEIHLFEALTRHLEEGCADQEEDLDGTPLSLLSTLLLHELTEVLVSQREKPGALAAHTVASTVERVWGRAQNLAQAVKAFFDVQLEAAGIADPLKRPRKAEGDQRGAKILVVEDSSMSRRVICGVVRQLGHTAIEASSGDEAVAAALEHEPHLIVLDLALAHGQSGLEYLSIIRQNPAMTDIPVIVVTSSTDGKSVQAAAAQGITDYLAKPFHTSDLTSRIDRLLPAADEED